MGGGKEGKLPSRTCRNTETSWERVLAHLQTAPGPDEAMAGTRPEVRPQDVQRQSQHLIPWESCSGKRPWKGQLLQLHFELTPGQSIRIGEVGIKVGARRGERRAETSGSDPCHHLHPQQSPAPPRARGTARMDPERQSHQEEKGSLLPACGFAIRGMPSFPKQGVCSQELAWIRSRKLGG